MRIHRSLIASLTTSLLLSLTVGACQLAEPEATDEPATGTTEQAVCTYPTTVTFGTADAFNLVNPDPIPYGAPAYVFPQFDTYLTSIGVTQAIRKTYDSVQPDRHMVATLRHGLRGCFAGASSLTLCFRAMAHPGGSANDSVAIYNTNFSPYSFPVVYSSYIVPTLAPTWTSGTTATLCINLTAQMTGGLIGDMLQFRVQDDTAVDHITMTMN